MMKRSRLLIGIMLLLLPSCVTKKQQTFNFGGGRDYVVAEAPDITPEDKTVTPEIIESDTLTESVLSTKERTTAKKGMAYRIAQKKVNRILKKQISKAQLKMDNQQEKFEDESKRKRYPGLIGTTATIVALLLSIFISSQFILAGTPEILLMVFVPIFLAMTFIYRHSTKEARGQKHMDKNKGLSDKAIKRRKMWRSIFRILISLLLIYSILLFSDILYTYILK